MIWCIPLILLREVGGQSVVRVRVHFTAGVRVNLYGGVSFVASVRGWSWPGLESF